MSSAGSAGKSLYSELGSFVSPQIKFQLKKLPNSSTLQRSNKTFDLGFEESQERPIVVDEAFHPKLVAMASKLSEKALVSSLHDNFQLVD